MDKNEIEAVKANILKDYTERINKLKAEMDLELSVLDKIEARFKELAPVKKSHKAKSPSPDRVKAPLAKDRIMDVVRKMSGEFTRKDLHATVNNDGYGEMKNGTFSPNVTNLVGKEIIETQKAVGNEPAKYRLADNQA